MHRAVGALPDADAAALLALAADATLAQRFATATQLLQLAAAAVASPPSGGDLTLLVQAGHGLGDCGEVQLAARVLRYVQAHAPPPTEATPEVSAILAAAAVTLARAVAWDGSVAPAEQARLILAAAKASPSPAEIALGTVGFQGAGLQFHLWAANVLKFHLGRPDDESAMVLERGVLTAPIGTLDLSLPSLGPKLSWMHKRLVTLAKEFPSAGTAARLAAFESRLAAENPAWTEVISRGMVEFTTATVGSPSDRWRSLHPSSMPFFRHSSAPTALTLDGVANPVQIVPLSREPLAFVVDGFASASECDALIAFSRSKLERSTVGSETVDEMRTSSSAVRLQTHLNRKVVRQLTQRAASLLRIPGVLPSDLEMNVVR